MSRRKSPVLLPQPAASILRRSARLNSLQNLECKGKSSKDLLLGSVPLSKSRRKIEPEISKRLAYSPSSKKSPSASKEKSPRCSSTKPASKSTNVSSSCIPRRTPRFSDASKEKSARFTATKPVSTPSSRMKTTNVLDSCTLRRSPRFSSGGGSLNSLDSSNGNELGNRVLSRCSTKSISSDRGKGGDCVKSRDRSKSRVLPKTKQMFSDSDDDDYDEEFSICLSERKKMRIEKPNEDENAVAKADKGKRIGRQERLKTKNKVVSRCSTKSVSSNRGKGGDGAKSRGRSKSRVHPKTKQMLIDCDDDDDEEEEEEVSFCLSERKKMRIETPKADEGKRMGKEEKEEERLKTKNKLDDGWTEDLDLALQGAYLTVKPSPHFWKKVAKMVPGKSAQECFDRVNSELITPRQLQPRSRAKKPNLSPIPQFSLSASKLLKPNSPKIKIRQGRNNLSKKTIRHLLEKQNHIDQGLEFDLFSVLEPSTSNNFLSTPMEKRQSLPKIVESPKSTSKDETPLVSPPVLKKVKNKALHEKYIDHLHIREAKRKAESTRMARKENIRPTDIQKKDSARAAKDAIFFELQDAVQKLKVIEAEKSSSSSEFCDDQDNEEESI